MKVYPVHNSFFGKKEWDFDNEARIFLRSLSLIKKNKDELLIKDYYNRIKDKKNKTILERKFIIEFNKHFKKN
jgi:hypothetical protein